MFKLLPFLFIPFMISTLSSHQDNHFHESNIEEKLDDGDSTEDVLHGYTYTDTTVDGQTNRVFDSKDLAPEINQRFNAPSGYTFVTSIDSERLTEIGDQLDFAKCSYSFVDPVIYYEVSGTKIYVNSYPMWTDESSQSLEERKELILDGLKFFLTDLELFYVDYVQSETTISVVLEIQFVLLETGDYFTFVLNGQPFTYKPYDVTDFVIINTFYYQNADTGEARITIYGSPIPGFFNEIPDYNEHGFKTDTTTPAGDDGWECVYEMTLYGNDSIPLGKPSRHQGGVEITYPTEPISVTAKMTFTSGGKEYTYYSKPVVVGDPNISILIDGYTDRTSVERGSVHSYSFSFNEYDYDSLFELDVYAKAHPERLCDDELGVELYDNPVLPSEGEANKYYYIPSENEIALYKQGKIDEINSSPFEGTYYTYDVENKQFIEFEGVTIFEENFDSTLEDQKEPDLSANISFPFVGKWRFHVMAMVYTSTSSCYFESSRQTLEVLNNKGAKEELIFNVPDNVNLVMGSGPLTITSEVSNTIGDDVTYYYDWQLSKEGILDYETNEGDITITPKEVGVVTLTLSVESRNFDKISKTINIRVLDKIYDVSSLQIPDEFHYSGKDLTVSLSIRGFTNIYNLNLEWKVLKKNGEDLSKDKYVINNDATLTLIKPTSDDYVITALYEGIEVGRITFQVRDVDVNLFLHNNIWWIVLMTAVFLAFVLFLQYLLKRSKTTVEHIERVYGVFCQCLSNDTLSYDELKRIRREITRCLHRCEDLNIDALNQYEKATRYLRKSLNDVKYLLKRYNNLTNEEREIKTEALDKDLSKALNVAKEIEHAKDIINDYHQKANRHNYERLEDDKKKKVKKEEK